MEEIHHEVEVQKQEDNHDCVQTSASALLSFYDVRKTPSEIKKEVPVYHTKEGKALGSSVGHVASYFVDLGFKTILHTSDTVLFDQSWKGLSAEELREKIEARKGFIRHAVYDVEAIGVVCDGFVQLLQKGGKIVMEVVDELYLHNLLKRGPVFFVVNYQYLFESPRVVFESGKSLPNDIGGQATTHVVIVVGYKDGKFEVVDSVRSVEEAVLWVDASRLVAAYYLADVELDSVLITLEK